MKTVFLVAGRLKSTRLPDKLRLPILGRPAIAHLLDRARATPHVSEVIVCTSTNPQDDPIVDLAAREGAACFRGHEDDVIRRLHDAASWARADYVLHITADCPLVDPVYAGRIVEEYQRTGADLIRSLDLPHGAFSYGIAPSALRRVIEIKDETNTEVWGRYFTDTDAFTVHDLTVEPRHRRPEMRLTLDYPEDLELLRAVFEALGSSGRLISLDEVIGLLDANPEVAALNRGCAERYRARWNSQAAAIRLKPRHDVRRAAVIGCGSIGQRHVRNLQKLGITEIVALKGHPGHTRRLDPSLGVTEVDGWDALLAASPDVAIVSNPTSLHLETARALTPHVRGMFIEKPLAAGMAGVGPWLDEVRAHRVVSFVGHVLAFHPAMRAMHERLQEDACGEPLAFQCQVGQYLPSWHPNEDHRRTYYGRDDLGGGVVRTLVHELHLALWLMGPAARVAAFVREAAELDVTVDAVADLLVGHAGGRASHIHLDYLQRPIARSGLVICDRARLTYDLVAGYAMEQPGAEPARDLWRDTAFDWNQAFLDEMDLFLRYVREGRWRHEHDAWSAAPSLALVDAAFESSRSGRVVPIEKGPQ